MIRFHDSFLTTQQNKNTLTVRAQRAAAAANDDSDTHDEGLTAVLSLNLKHIPISPNKQMNWVISVDLNTADGGGGYLRVNISAGLTWTDIQLHWSGSSPGLRMLWAAAPLASSQTCNSKQKNHLCLVSVSLQLHLNIWSYLIFFWGIAHTAAGRVKAECLLRAESCVWLKHVTESCHLILQPWNWPRAKTCQQVMNRISVSVVYMKETMDQL